MSSYHSVVFRCDGSKQIGLGHIMRCSALAAELQDLYGWRITFAIRQDSLGIGVITQHGFPVVVPESGTSDHGEWLESIIHNTRAQVLVLDVRDDLPRETIKRIRGRGVLIATIDDPSERRLEADLAFYPPVPQLKQVDWTGFTGRLYTGWDWIVLRREFVQSRFPKVHNQPPKVLITMGGSDPAGLTLHALSALKMLHDILDVVVALGPGFLHEQSLQELAHASRHSIDLRRNVHDMPTLMAEMDVAVVSFGVTAYELATLGIPSVIICLTDDHAQSATPFERENIGIVLGTYSQVSKRKLAHAVKTLLHNQKLREKMSARAQQLIDGQGASHIAQTIVKEVTHHYD